MFVSWILFPLLLTALCLGCGLLLEAATGRRLPGPLLAPAGFGVLLVATWILTSRGETAPLATAAVILLAGAGAALTYPWSDRRLDRWALAAALGVYAVYAAPIVLSGHPSFAGYIKLDDTATWLTLVDHVMAHGRDLSGLEPSSYQTTLEVNLPGGYPVGAFLPLGIGSRLTGTDVAWLVQPYMATMAALLALCMYWLVRPLVESRPLRALVAFGAAQSALLFAYSLWGGIKEVALALTLAALAAVAPAAARTTGWRGALPAAFATAAVLTLLGTRGFVVALPILIPVAVALWRSAGFRATLDRAWPLALLIAILGLPAFLATGAFAPTEGSIDNAEDLGNLIAPLGLAQYVGVWIGGDFRVDPTEAGLTDYLIVLALLAALAGAWLAWRRRAWELLLYAGGVGAGSIAIFVYASPWVGAKALASGSPSLLLLALAGAAAFAVRYERVLGTTVLGLVLVGVLWSNALGYHDASIAPYDQLRELESIGEEFAGEGPTLMTEYQPYGVRHFLREADPEGASELRNRPVPLVAGGELEKGEWGDTDELSLPALLTYRTLVLRRNPAQSRPPSAYSLARRGEYYEVWQRPPELPATAILQHLPLGDSEDPGAEPVCSEVRGLAALAGPGGTVAAAERAPTVSASLAASSHPPDWPPTEAGSPALLPGGPGAASLSVEVPAAGPYDFFVQGSVRNRLALLVDGVEVGAVKNQLNQGEQFLYFGRVPLEAGPHEVELVLDDQTLAPGSGGPPEPIGPLVLSPAANEDPPVRELPGSRAEELCDRHLDWVEALPQGGG